MDQKKNILTKQLLKDIENELGDLDYGSLEIYVQSGVVTQITKRRIRKTDYLTRSGK